MNKLITKLLGYVLPMFLAPAFCLAQGFTFGWNGGFGWQPGSTQNIPGPYINTINPAVDKFVNLANSSDANGSYKALCNSYGHGFNTGLSIGYMFNAYVGINIGVNYTQSVNISATQLHTLYLPDSTGAYQNTGGYVNCTLATQSRCLSLSPSVTLAYNKPKYKFYPYLRAGLVLPVWTQITHTGNLQLVGYAATASLNEDPYYLGNLTTFTLQTVPNFTMGFNGAVGVVLKANPFLNFFLEINGQYLNMKGNYTQITQWTADGNDLLANRPLYRTLFEYVNKLSSTSNNAAYNSNFNPSAAKQDISPNFPFSNIGFNLGVQLCLTSKIFKDKDAFEENRELKKKKKPKKADANSTPPPATNP
jgi:hypothetical protein